MNGVVIGVVSGVVGGVVEVMGGVVSGVVDVVSGVDVMGGVVSGVVDVVSGVVVGVMYGEGESDDDAEFVNGSNNVRGVVGGNKLMCCDGDEVREAPESRHPCITLLPFTQK